MPKVHQSTADDCPEPLITSGAMYSSVPTNEFVSIMICPEPFPLLLPKRLRGEAGEASALRPMSSRGSTTRRKSHVSVWPRPCGPGQQAGSEEDIRAPHLPNMDCLTCGAVTEACLDRSKALRAPSRGLSLAWTNSLRTDSRILEKGLTMFSSTSFDRD